jgi:radical SAM family uncharacterized protein/radical SAM-linked protein
MVFLTVNLSFFQKPSRYINNEIHAVHKEAPVKVALAFPDIYEIGMSHLGLKILYKIINDLPYASAERVFSPWTDLEAEMKAKSWFLSSLESNRPLKDFHIVGFSLQYELSYTTVLNMLHLGGIPAETENRMDARYPLVIAGGPCTVNPLPMSPFIDAFLIGDGEEAIGEILDTYYRWEKEGDNKKESLFTALAEIEGLYVPFVHDSGSGNVHSGSRPPFFINRRIISSLDEAPYPVKPVIPYTSIVHDRINIEVSRGCSMGCRFCQAGMIYRPVRERSPEKVLELAGESLRNTGYEEVTFTSLSAGDYSCLLPLVKEFNKRFSKDTVALSLPSLRVAAINRDLLKEMRTVRKTGFTIAPEAGTDRLRKVINKDFSEEDYRETLKILFDEGWQNLKLYFMIGLPTETDEDIEAIPKMAMQALRTAKEFTKRFINISVGVSPFVPKAHTPFQWYGQTPVEELNRKKHFIKQALLKKKFNVKGHDVRMSLLEAAFARGDRNLSNLLKTAWSLGCRLDGWSEVFAFPAWEKAMDMTGIDAQGVASKTYDQSDSLPWDTIHIGVTKEYLWKEYRQALAGVITTDCRKVCHNCGLECLKKTEKGKFGEGEGRTPESLNAAKHPGFAFPQMESLNRFRPVKIRAEFSKTGRLKYLSHLEIMVLLQRAIRRAGFPLEYSKGFHPSPKVAFGPPLGVGIAGLSEYFDMELTPPFDLIVNKNKLNNLLPEGVHINTMVSLPAQSESLNNFIARYEYEVRGGDIQGVRNFLSETDIPINREKLSINIRNMVEKAEFIDENTVNCMVTDLGNIKVRLGELLPLVFQAPLESLEITRVALYGWNGGWVKPVGTGSMQLINTKR